MRLALDSTLDTWKNDTFNTILMQPTRLGYTSIKETINNMAGACTNGLLSSTVRAGGTRKDSEMVQVAVQKLNVRMINR